MAAETQATIEEMANVFKLLDSSKKNALLLIGEGMAIANGITYNQIKEARAQQESQ